jgi:hypothetical protein
MHSALKQLYTCLLITVIIMHKKLTWTENCTQLNKELCFHFWWLHHVDSNKWDGNGLHAMTQNESVVTYFKILILTPIWKDWGTPQETSIGIVGNPAEIQTRYFPNTSLESACSVTPSCSGLIGNVFGEVSNLSQQGEQIFRTPKCLCSPCNML